MTARELVEYLQMSRDMDVQVVVEGSDHSFRRITSVQFEQAELTKDKDLYAYFDDSNMSPKSKKIGVVVIG